MRVAIILNTLLRRVPSESWVEVCGVAESGLTELNGTQCLKIIEVLCLWFRINQDASHSAVSILPNNKQLQDQASP